MKTKTNKKPKYLDCVPDGRLPITSDSWAERWINLYDNGGIGYEGSRMPTKEEKEDIRKRIQDVQILLQQRIFRLRKAWDLMK